MESSNKTKLSSNGFLTRWSNYDIPLIIEIITILERITTAGISKNSGKRNLYGKQFEEKRVENLYKCFLGLLKVFWNDKSTHLSPLTFSVNTITLLFSSPFIDYPFPSFESNIQENSCHILLISLASILYHLLRGMNNCELYTTLLQYVNDVL
jgi:hypothetical protein